MYTAFKWYVKQYAIWNKLFVSVLSHNLIMYNLVIGILSFWLEKVILQFESNFGYNTFKYLKLDQRKRC